MRILISIAFGYALLIGINHAASSGPAEHAAPPPAEISPAAAEDTLDEGQPENETAYECKYSPYCQRASQCTTYCAGGVPVCFQGCCSCAS